MDDLAIHSNWNISISFNPTLSSQVNVFGYTINFILDSERIRVMHVVGFFSSGIIRESLHKFQIAISSKGAKIGYKSI